MTKIIKNVAGATADLAKRIGPKRAIIGAVSVVAAGAAIFLVRFLKGRSAAAGADESLMEGASSNHHASRKERKKQHAAMQH